MIRATIQPKKIDDMRKYMLPLIGKTFNFDFCGTSDADEMYPSQKRYMIAREHDGELTDEQIGRWFPEEDLHIHEKDAK